MAAVKSYTVTAENTVDKTTFYVQATNKGAALKEARGLRWKHEFFSRYDGPVHFTVSEEN